MDDLLPRADTYIEKMAIEFFKKFNLRFALSESITTFEEVETLRHSVI